MCWICHHRTKAHFSERTGYPVTKFCHKSNSPPQPLKYFCTHTPQTFPPFSQFSFPRSPPPSLLFDIMSFPIIWAKILSTLHSVYLQTSSFPILKCISNLTTSHNHHIYPSDIIYQSLSPDSYNTIFHFLLQFAPNSQVVLSTTVREIVVLLPCLKL